MENERRGERERYEREREHVDKEQEGKRGWKKNL